MTARRRPPAPEVLNYADLPLTPSEKERLEIEVNDQLTKLLPDETVEKILEAGSRGDKEAWEKIFSESVGGQANLARITANTRRHVYAQILHDREKRGNVASSQMHESEPQSIVDRARAEALTQAPGEPSHALPNTTADLTIVMQAAGQLLSTLTEIHEDGIPLTATEVELSISGLREIIKFSNSAAWKLGLHAVEKGLLSQAALAGMLGVSTATVSRRFHEGLPDDIELDRTDVRTNPIQ